MVLAKRIIPCLDVMKGRVVKGVQFTNLIDAGDPAEQALTYDKAGADEVVFLDITASSENREIIKNVVKKTAEQLSIPFTVGGGLQTVDDIRDILYSGADKISLNTAAVKDPSLIKEGAGLFGSQCIVVAIDAKRHYVRMGEPTVDHVFETDEGKQFWWELYTYGGRKATGLDAVIWAKQVERLGGGEILLTSMDKDGTKEGYDILLTRAITRAVNIPVIASGGAGLVEHIFEVLTRGRADAALAASIFHFGLISIKEVKSYLNHRNIPVRPIVDVKESEI
ncbi:MAG: imidazole glycerol phosphate synthase subunit HisF [Candidatus Ranarchaeia archaeon]|jgi:cyclase